MKNKKIIPILIVVIVILLIPATMSGIYLGKMATAAITERIGDKDRNLSEEQKSENAGPAESDGSGSADAGSQSEELTAISSEEANGMKLDRYLGSLQLWNADQQEEEVYEGRFLADGNQMNTAGDSYAWINLDDEKELKMDEESAVILNREEGRMRIQLEDGSLFFCVQKLNPDESLDFVMSNTMLSIQGTTGILQQVSDIETVLLLLEGEVLGQMQDGTIYTARSGERVSFQTLEDGSCKAYARHIYEEDIPAFAREAMEEDEIHAKIISGGGSDYHNSNGAYADAVYRLIQNNVLPDGTELVRNEFGIDGNLFAIADVDGDGSDELLIQWSDTFTYAMGSYCYHYDLGSKQWSGDMLEGVWIETEDCATGLLATSYTRMGYSVITYLEYNPSLDRFERTGSDDQNIDGYSNPNERSFPADLDTDGDGVVHAIQWRNYDGSEISDDEYQNFLSAIIGDRPMMDLQMWPVSMDSYHTLFGRNDSEAAVDESRLIQDGAYRATCLRKGDSWDGTYIDEITLEDNQLVLKTKMNHYSNPESWDADLMIESTHLVFPLSPDARFYARGGENKPTEFTPQEFIDAVHWYNGLSCSLVVENGMVVEGSISS